MPQTVRLTPRGLTKLQEVMQQAELQPSELHEAFANVNISLESAQKICSQEPVPLTLLEQCFGIFGQSLSNDDINQIVDDPIVVPTSETIEPQLVKTIVYTDIVGFSLMCKRFGNGIVPVLLQHDNITRLTCDEYHGTIVKAKGDGFILAFDQALDALLFAINLQRRMAAQTGRWQLEEIEAVHLRAALDTGTVIPYHTSYGLDYHLGPMIRAARLESITQGGQILISQTTNDLVRDALRNPNLAPEEIRLTSKGRTALKGIEVFEIFQVNALGVEADYPLPIITTNIPDNIPNWRTRWFVGREMSLNRLANQLHPPSAYQRDRVVGLTQAITGLGGIGKTQTALEFARRCKRNEPGFPQYTAYLWCNAESEEALHYGFVALANTLSLPEADAKNSKDAVDAVKHWLMTPTNADWLLILDNADEPEAVARFFEDIDLTEAPGSLLITSRKTDLQELGITQPLLLDVLQDSEAAAFWELRTNLKARSEQEKQAATDLAQELGMLPLAMEQAAAFVNKQGQSFVNYLLRFRQVGVSHTSVAKPVGGRYQQTVATTWQITFDALPPDAKRVLEICALLAPDPIPYKVLASLSDFSEEMLQPLLDYMLLTLLQKEEAPDSTLELANSELQMHRLVQAVSRNQMSAEVRNLREREAIDAITTAFPYVEFSNWAECERLLPHALLCTEAIHTKTILSTNAGRLMNEVGYYLQERGKSLTAEPFIREGLEIRRQTLPENHPDIAISLNNLAVLLKEQGRYDEAEPYARASLTVRRHAHPEGHPKIAANLNNLALLLKAQGRLDEAEPFLREALAIFRNNLPEGHPHIGSNLNNLALLLLEQNRFVEAEPVLREALEIFRASLPEKHPHIGTAIYNLSNLLTATGEYQEAERLATEALAIRRSALPADHPHIALSLHSFGQILTHIGRDEEAEPYFREALRIRRKALPDGHSETSETISRLGDVLEKLGQGDEAASLQKEASSLRKSV